MPDREKAIRIIEGNYKNFVLRHNGELLTGNELIAMLKDSGQDEGWICEKRTSGRQITDLLCACGNKVYFTSLLFRDGFTANELFCPNCGLSMRSPHYDKDGVWLRKHWEEVVLKAQEPVKPLDENYWKHTRGRCVHCKAPLPAIEGLRSKFCWMCGRPVKWDD